MLTKEQKKEYNNSSGTFCPYCKSEQIEALEFDAEAWGQKVFCQDCKKQWWDVYRFVGIEEIQ